MMIERRERRLVGDMYLPNREYEISFLSTEED
jgi:hypothetical protein